MSFFKNNSSATSGGSLTNPKVFYNLCVQEYNKSAKAEKQATRDTIFIPELMAYGQKAILWFLQNEELSRQIPDPLNYYYIAVNTAIRCGILFAVKWHEDYSGLQRAGYVETVMKTGPSVLTDSIIKKDLGMNDQQFGSFCMKVFKRWNELHEPYWKLQDPRNYTFYATLAAYQLGISMILCKYGY